METATLAPPAVQMEKLKSQVEMAPPPAPAPVEKASMQDQGKAKVSKTVRRSHFSKVKGRKGKPGKIHIRLPSIESYQKEICFPAEAPGRVVVRLERLMGSDKIRPVDGKYMETLIQRLEEEEFLAWERKIRLRKKAEKERHRQLAINGLMEPGPGMEDLYNHPVFRVNRILNRLTKMDNILTHKPGQKLPPISQIEPFKIDETGKYFCDYPTHVELRRKCQKYKSDLTQEEQDLYDEQLMDELDGLDNALAIDGYSTKSYVDFVASAVATKANLVTTAAPPPSEASVGANKEDEDEETDEETVMLGNAYVGSTSHLKADETDGEGTPLTEMEVMALKLQTEYMESLTTLQDRYGVPQSSDFEETWKPYRSEIIESFFNDPDSMEQVYTQAREIIGVYVRQDMEARDHVEKNPLKPKTAEDEEEEEGISASVAASITGGYSGMVGGSALPSAHPSMPALSSTQSSNQASKAKLDGGESETEVLVAADLQADIASSDQDSEIAPSEVTSEDPDAEE